MKYFLFVVFLISAPIQADPVYNRTARNALIRLVAGIVLVGPTWWVIVLATPEGSHFISHATFAVRRLFTDY